MSQPPTAPLPAQVYEICVYENLDDDLTTWFSPLTVDHASGGATTLTVLVRDQTELHGLIVKIRDLNLTIIAIINQQLMTRKE